MAVLPEVVVPDQTDALAARDELWSQLQAYGPEEVTRVGAALEAVTAVVLRIDEQRAVGRAPQRADLEIDVAALTPGDFGILQAVLDDAVQLSRNRQLLVLPPLPEVIALRDWFCGEAVAQASGAQPSPWTLESDNGPLDQAPAVWTGQGMSGAVGIVVTTASTCR